MGEARFNPRAHDFRPTQAVVQDARGRALQDGDEILLAMKTPPYFRVMGVVPVLDPRAPAGTMLVHVGTMMTFTVRADRPTPELIRVQTAAEAGPTNFELLEAQPDGGDA